MWSGSDYLIQPSGSLRGSQTLGAQTLQHGAIYVGGEGQQDTAFLDLT